MLFKLEPYTAWGICRENTTISIQARDVVLEAAVSARGRLEAVFQPVSPSLCLSNHLPWLGSASDILPRPL